MGLTLDLAHARKLTREDTLLRALGKEARTVVDATAGLGRDAASLARLGISVVAIERSPPVIDAWRDALAFAPWTLSFLAGDARDHLRAFMQCGFRPDAILLDPMYADASRKSAQEKALKELRDLVGDDVDAADLLAVARACSDRIVVKRPKHAPALAPGVAHAWTGSSTRYDLYVASPVVGAGLPG